MKQRELLLLDGVYTTNRHGKRRFQYVSAPLSDELTSLVHTISHRIACFLERQGLLERDMEQSYLILEEDDDPMSQIHGHSITYRITVGAQQGQKVFTLQTLPPCDNESNEAQIGQISGFSLHAGIMARGDQRKKLERLCRYIRCPAVSERRSKGKVLLVIFTSTLSKTICTNRVGNKYFYYQN